MSRYAISLALGPVGGFIGAGRRSRDLWWGSTWLSHATVEVASWLSSQGARLVLPAPGRVQAILEALEEESRGQRPQLAYGGRVANHVLALVDRDEPEQVRRLLEGAQSRANAWLARQMDAAVAGAREGLERRAQGAALDRVVSLTGFADQRTAVQSGQDFLELYGAWSEVGPEEDDGLALKAADALAGLRKTTRDFLPPPWTLPGRPKSDLDAGRDSVLLEDGPDLARAALGIRRAERLDAIGLARRVAAFEQRGAELGRLPFPPLSRVAAEPWLMGALQQEGARAVQRIVALLREALDDPATGAAFFAWCSPACDPDLLPAVPSRDHRFPFDASVLFEGGVEALAADLERAASRGSEPLARAARLTIHTTLAELQRLVRALHARFGPPEPYYALVAMDGDGVGTALREAIPAGRLGPLVVGLDRFADEVEAKVREVHHGRVLYAGGDDLLFLVPLNSMLEALADIARGFRDCMVASPRPLHLSAGVVIAHVRADLRGVRGLASRALQQAKRSRDQHGASLCLHETPRSGAPRVLVGPFDALIARLQGWRAGLQLGALSRRTPEILDGLRLSVGAHSDERDATSLELARGRLLAQLERARRPGQPRAPVVEALMRRVLDEVHTWGEVEQLADEIRVASRIVAVDTTSRGEGGAA